MLLEATGIDPVCMDRYEAPNRAGAEPLVMYTFDEASAWCMARGRRLCLDTEWQAACEGPDATAYPYGDTRDPGRCNDEETWRTYNQTLLNGWPTSASAVDIESLDALLEAAAATGSAGSAAAAHISDLYQGEGSGDNTACDGYFGIYDLTGNVEEWTRRADGGTTSFHGNLKGRYWADSRTCQQNITSHGDGFRFYEIGFRCCRAPDDGRRVYREPLSPRTPWTPGSPSSQWAETPSSTPSSPPRSPTSTR